MGHLYYFSYYYFEYMDLSLSSYAMLCMLSLQIFYHARVYVIAYTISLTIVIQDTMPSIIIFLILIDRRKEMATGGNSDTCYPTATELLLYPALA